MGKVRLSQQERANRWDELISHLKDPRIRNTHVRHLSAMRRAVNMLLSAREELPVGLVAELKSYVATLDELCLEAVDGFAGVSGILDLLPTQGFVKVGVTGCD
jgi:hypothetical protein